MKEYLTKNSNGDYQLVNHRFSDDDIKVPDGAEIAYLHKDDGIEFSKMQEGEFYRYYWGEWHESSFDNIQELSQETFFDSALWKRSTIVEYLNPADWSLHVVDVDNDTAGEDWIKVPEGAEKFLKISPNYNQFFRYNFKQVWNGERWVETVWVADNLKIWRSLKVLWQRHTPPEELPFVDDEPKTAWRKQEGGSHYKDLKIQPMQYALDNKLDYAQANVVKYVTRHANKNGKEDLLKAIHNIELMIEYYYGDKEQSQ